LKARESLDTNVKRLIGELEALQRSSTISEQRLVAELVGVRAEHEAASMASAEAAARRESRLSDQHVTAQNDVAAAEEEVRQERGARRASEALEVENHRIAAETHRTARLTAAVEDLRSQLESVRASLTKTEVALREATYRVNAHAVRTDAAEVGGVKSQFRFTQVYSKR
jgi:chromosome segregation ATPase